VGKLSMAERRQVVNWVLAEVAGRLPVAVTIADGNMPDMADAARHAEGAGAAWLILQPPRPPASGPDLITFFATIAGATRLPVAIQNAPEFLGIGLTADELIALHERAPNVTAVKGEASATIIARLIVALGGRMPVLNGRAGQELTDNYRAGVAGMIPGSRRWTGRSPSRGPCWRANTSAPTTSTPRCCRSSPSSCKASRASSPTAS
jgi:4-hydroxy-tetrahydrodipicolinate synthase